MFKKFKKTDFINIINENIIPLSEIQTEDNDYEDGNDEIRHEYNEYPDVIESKYSEYEDKDYEEDEEEEQYEKTEDDEGDDWGDEEYEIQKNEIEMVNEWNANKRTGVIIDVYEKNEKNKEFNKNIYVFSKKINEDIESEYEINEGDIKEIQVLAGKIDDIEYKNPVCFILAYKFISMSIEKKYYLNFIKKYINILNDRFGYMNIGKKDLIRYIIFIERMKIIYG